MTGTLHMAWDDQLTRYDFGPGHPLNPVRVELTMELAREFGLLAHPNVTVEGFQPADDALLRLVHEPAYLEAVKQCAGIDGGRLTNVFCSSTPMILLLADLLRQRLG